MPKPRKIESRNVAEESTHDRDVRWVLEHLSDPTTEEDEKPKERSAPSKAAWRLFKMYDVDEDTRMMFVEKIYRGVVQKEKPPESGKGMSDDQRKFFRLFDLIEAERPEFLNERAHRPHVPPVFVEPAVAEPVAPELAVADEPVVIAESAPRVEDSAVAAGPGIDEPGTAVVEPDIDPFALAEIVNSQAQAQAGCGV